MRPGGRLSLSLLSLVFAVAPGNAASGNDPPPPARGGADYRIAVWYHRDRPLETFRYQVYDMRKGEYSPAVDNWLALMKSRYPAYEVHVRDVVLAREQGTTEAIRLGSALRRELLAAAARQGIFLGDPTIRLQTPRPMLPAASPLAGRPLAPPAGSSGTVDFHPPPPSFPVPVPYPRPHP